jgi:transglutaminase-like putative cysteine protease
MQRIRIHHLTEYHFSSSVTLNQHRLLIRPREGHDVRIEWSRLDIFPAYRIKWQRDMFDNSLALVEFNAPTNRLTIASEVMIQHYEHAPFDFMLDDSAATYPFRYAFDEQADLAAYQQPMYQADQPAVHQWLQQFHVTEKNTFGLLMEMNRMISLAFCYRMREEAGVQSPAFTLNQRSGSCRDYATLLIEACRGLGLASRFVSGYLLAPATEVGNATTHAWVEVYLPGAGWKGFDPTTGHVVSNQHIAVAVARNPESVPPVSGSFIGTNLTTSRLTVNVQVNLVKSVL